MDWFLYDNGLRHERIKQTNKLRKEMDRLSNKGMPNIYLKVTIGGCF